MSTPLSKKEREKLLKEQFAALPEHFKQSLLEAWAEEAERNSIVAEFTQHENVLCNMRYELQSFSSDRSVGTFVKHVISDEPTLAVKIWREDENKWKAEITHMVGLVKITSGEFSFPHPDFERIFEAQVARCAFACRKLQPNWGM